MHDIFLSTSSWLGNRVSLHISWGPFAFAFRLSWCYFSTMIVAHLAWFCGVMHLSLLLLTGCFQLTPNDGSRSFHLFLLPNESEDTKQAVYFHPSLRNFCCIFRLIPPRTDSAKPTAAVFTHLLVLPTQGFLFPPEFCSLPSQGLMTLGGITIQLPITVLKRPTCLHELWQSTS